MSFRILYTLLWCFIYNVYSDSNKLLWINLNKLSVHHSKDSPQIILKKISALLFFNSKETQESFCKACWLLFIVCKGKQPHQ